VHTFRLTFSLFFVSTSVGCTQSFQVDVALIVEGRRCLPWIVDVDVALIVEDDVVFLGSMTAAVESLLGARWRRVDRLGSWTRR
jgi:hypothetical protein